MSGPATMRKVRGLTIEQAAKRAGISSGYLRQLEGRGGALPPLRLAARLAKLYGCPLTLFVRERTAEARESVHRVTIDVSADLTGRRNRDETVGWGRH